MKKFLFFLFLILFIFCTCKFIPYFFKKVKIYNEFLLKSRQKVTEMKNKYNQREKAIKEKIEKILETEEKKSIP